MNAKPHPIQHIVNLVNSGKDASEFDDPFGAALVSLHAGHFASLIQQIAVYSGVKFPEGLTICSGFRKVQETYHSTVILTHSLMAGVQFEIEFHPHHFTVGYKSPESMGGYNLIHQVPITEHNLSATCDLVVSVFAPNWNPRTSLLRRVACALTELTSSVDFGHADSEVAPYIDFKLPCCVPHAGDVPIRQTVSTGFIAADPRRDWFNPAADTLMLTTEITQKRNLKCRLSSVSARDLCEKSDRVVLTSHPDFRTALLQEVWRRLV